MSEKEIKTICVFCASSSKVDEVYLNAAQSVADICISHSLHVLYGGGAVGLMGALSDRIIQRKGKITGIIPAFMLDMKWGHDLVEDMIVVEDMRERKRRMIENIDAVVALPGGVGTLEELLEVITLKQLGQFTKPIIIVNINGFYNPLLSMFDEMISQKFLRTEHQNIWKVISSPEELLNAINSSVTWDNSAIDKAAI
jgi:uncharacterized protein (TIGR00730 family)